MFVTLVDFLKLFFLEKVTPFSVENFCEIRNLLPNVFNIYWLLHISRSFLLICSFCFFSSCSHKMVAGLIGF